MCRSNSTIGLLSALYGIILFILGLAFPLAQVISSRIPPFYYEGFYLYIYFVAIGFLTYTHLSSKKKPNCALICTKKKRSTQNTSKQEVEMKPMDTSMMEHQLSNQYSTEQDSMEHVQANYGSFYLRMGAVVFGVGGMIYSGLDFGQYLDFDSDFSCYDAISALSPASRVAFTFLQMYFIFLNAKMQLVKLKSPKLAQFGLMHLMATNMCVWLNTIIEETHVEIRSAELIGGKDEGELGAHHSTANMHQNSPDLSGQSMDATIFTNLTNQAMQMNFSFPNISTSKRQWPSACRRTDLMSSLVENASPFLFPCAIEYSLICAATAYEIWTVNAHVSKNEADDDSDGLHIGSASTSRQQSIRNSRRSPYHYSVDCTKANKGLFFGIFVLVLTIIAMILFSVLINRDDYKSTAVTEVHVAELFLYGMALISVIVGMIQVRELHFDESHSLNLDEVLIIIAHCGNIAYSIFTILGAQFSDHPDKLLVMMTSLAALVQGITQTIFILDAYKRSLFTKTQQRRKPGREIVTFLLVTNFAMWALTTMEKSRADAHPLQSEFYGVWQWAIITNISTPLAIFYRYHSTVCLCEIWKRCYKVRDDLY